VEAGFKLGFARRVLWVTDPRSDRLANSGNVGMYPALFLFNTGCSRPFLPASAGPAAIKKGALAGAC
jgi:hypothetical protein